MENKTDLTKNTNFQVDAEKVGEILKKENVTTWRDLNFHELEYEDLLTIKITIESEIMNITDQIDRATEKARKEGVYADRDWFRNAHIAKKKRGQTLFKINTIARRKKDVLKKENVIKTQEMDIRWERAFVGVARRELLGRDFDRLCTLTDESISGNN